AEATLRLEMPEATAIETMNRWAGKPLPVSATAFAGGQLAVRLSGAAAAVKAACVKVGAGRHAALAHRRAVRDAAARRPGRDDDRMGRWPALAGDAGRGAHGARRG